MPGFDTDGVVYGLNVDFTGNSLTAGTAQVSTNGQLLIGSTATPNIKVGTLTSPDNSLTIGYSSPNVTLTVSGGGTVGKTITGDTGGGLAPTSGNWNILGQQASTLAVMDTIGSGSTLKIENRAWLTSLVVDPSVTVGLRGTFSTIATALTAATSGQTIFIRPGTYTENLTLKAGVNLTAFGSDSSLNQTGKVIISGKATLTTAGTVKISGIQLQTNSDFLLAVTGSAASIVNLQNCNLNCTNNTGISFSTSNSSGMINLNGCTGNLGTTGIGLYSSSSTGTININNSNITNSGASTTVSTNSAGIANFVYSVIMSPVSNSSTGVVNVNFSLISTVAQNVIGLTTAGSGTSSANFAYLSSGSASAASVGAGTTLFCAFCNLSSSNTNFITGAGTVTYLGLQPGSNPTSINNVTTQNGGLLIGLSNGTAPSGGFLGEQIRGAATAVNLGNGTAANITSINITAGIWDVSGCYDISCTSPNAITAITVSISTTSATNTGTKGDNNFIYNGLTVSEISAAIPSFRVTINTTTTYYLVAQSNFGAGTSAGNGRISATRVG